MLPEKVHVVTVNELDEQTGTMEKMEAHQLGILHRAFSVFILNDNNELLLQQRAKKKYHSGGLWTNTCCSHPMPEENTVSAAERRLKEEMGIECRVDPAFTFVYKADVGDGLIEHEYDHVFIGRYSGKCDANPDEVNGYQYLSLNEIENWIKKRPGDFTVWMRIAFPRFLNYLEKEERS